MTDQTFEEKVRKIASEMRDAMRREDDGYPYVEFLSDMGDYIRDLEALLPAPPRPTLADMTDEERAECQWMQADVDGFHEKLVIARIDQTDWSAVILDRNGRYDEVPAGAVTPRPDLPRMTWPGTEKPAPDLPGDWRVADHKDNGRVIVTTPNNDGRVYYVLPSDLDGLGFDWLFCHTEELTYIDQGNSTTTGPNTLAVGTVIESADDPRIAALPVGSILLDRDEEATTKRPGAWTGVGNTPNPTEGAEFGPWTVLHIPKEDDQ